MKKLYTHLLEKYENADLDDADLLSVIHRDFPGLLVLGYFHVDEVTANVFVHFPCLAMFQNNTITIQPMNPLSDDFVVYLDGLDKIVSFGDMKDDIIESYVEVVKRHYIDPHDEEKKESDEKVVDASAILNLVGTDK